MRLILLGPTAVGKTSVSLQLAKYLDAEIISSDSRQCYKYLNIGTATPTEKELQQVKHYNISIIDPAEKDSAAHFYRRSQQWEDDIESRGKNVLYVGGSTLHQRVAIQPFDEVPSANEENIAELEQQIEDEGLEALYKKLKEVDPAYIQKMDGMNRQRIIRALDVWMQTGKSFSSFHSNKPVEPDEDMLVIGIKRDRQNLYERINKRAVQMLKGGLLEEVQLILEKGYTRQDPGVNTVGYTQAIDFLNGQLSRNEMLEQIQAKTRQYSKRQMTWFKKWDFIHWVQADGKQPTDITREIENMIHKNT